MDQLALEGIRLLSFDGGDICAVSQLLILDEFMRRIEWDRKSTTRILPCDYFHMMAGVGTSGIIVMLLVTLRMGVEEAMEEFISIWTSVFADASLDQATRSAKLEATIKDLLERKGLPADQKMYNGDSEQSTCKAFVCAVPESNLGMCEKFRSYRSKQTSSNPTIIEAIRATCAIPTLFTPVSIESVGCQIPYVTGTYNFNNPAWETIKEGCETFGQSQPVACMLSLGCGQCPTVRLSQKNKSTSMNLVNDIASDSELVDRDLTWRIGKSNVYYRLSVDRTLESGGDSIVGTVGDITTLSKAFLEHPTTVDKVDRCTKASQCPERATLRDISGLSEPKRATAYGLPPLSAFFVKRPQLIKRMAQCLFRGGPPAQRRIVLSGLGGIGKTQITINFLHQFLLRFRHVLFIDASSVQSIESGIVAKVRSLGITYSQTSASEALEVLANPDHEITRDWAIVYDNVDNCAINIARYFPQCSFGTIFITTRNPNLGNLARKAHLRLDVMSEDEATDVLLRTAFEVSHLITDADRQHAHEIAEELGYLPVALVQAGYFINIHECIHDYRQRLRRRRPDILSRPARHQLDPHYHGVYATLDVAWPYLSPRAQNFMSILGFVNYTGFPVLLLYLAAECGFRFQPFTLMDRPALFQQTIQLLCTTFRPEEESDTQDIDDVVAELERYSLVTHTTTFMVTTLRLHSLVHSWTHDRLSKEEREVYRAAAVRLLVCGTDTDHQDLYEFIYSHITLMSDRLADLHVNDQAGVAAVLAHQGDIKTAIELWEGIQGKVRVCYGRDDLRSGDADLQLSHLYWMTRDNGKQADALLLEQETIDIRKRTLGPEHPLTMHALVQLASDMARDGRKWDVAAAPILRDALKYWEGQHGDHRETVLQVKEELARVCNPNQRISLSTEIMQARMERSGPDHHATLRAMENLARAYEDWWPRGSEVDDDKEEAQEEEAMGKYATNTWISVVAARTNKRGVEHPDTLRAMENLAQSYAGYSKFRTSGDDILKAEAQWSRVVELRKAIQGQCHRDTLEAMAGLRRMYSDMYRLKEIQENKAICLAQEIVHLTKEGRGRCHEDTLSAMKGLAEMYEKFGKYTECVEQWKEVVCLRRTQGPTRELTFLAMKNLAQVYEKFGKYTECVELGKEIVILGKAADPTHWDALSAIEYLARFYDKHGKYAECTEQWKGIVIWRRARDPAHEDTLSAMENLAKVYARSLESTPNV